MEEKQSNKLTKAQLEAQLSILKLNREVCKCDMCSIWLGGTDKMIEQIKNKINNGIYEK